MTTPAEEIQGPRFEHVVNEFNTFFDEKGYTCAPSVPIASSKNSTTRFVGAPISALGELLVDERVEHPGVFVVQNCVKTHFLGSSLDIETEPQTQSFFRGMCVLTPGTNAGGLVNESVEFFTSRLGLNPEDLVFDINRADEEIELLVDKTGLPTEHNRKGDESSYRHKYGIEGVYGKDIGIELRRPDGSFGNIAVLVAIYFSDKLKMMELSFSDTALMVHQRGLQHYLDCYEPPIFDLDQISPAMRLRMRDSVITAMALSSEGLSPGAKDNRTRLMRSYLKRISLYRQLGKIGDDEIYEYASQYSSGVLPLVEMVDFGTFLVDWLQRYEKKLAERDPDTLSDEDHAILNLIKENN